MSFDIGSVVAHIKADITDFKTGLGNAQDSLKSFKDKAVDGLEGVRNVALVASGAITAVGFATLKLGEHAGKYESIRDAFSGMTKEMGINVEDFEKKVADASKGTIDRLTILSGANKAMSLIGKEAFNDFGNDFAKMAELSKKAARATGQDVGFMFDSLITGVSRGSKMILDNLGITMNMEDAQAKYAASLMETNKMTEDQAKKASLLRVVIEELDSTYKDVAVSGGGYQGALQAMNTTLENAKIEIGLAVIPILNDLVRTLTPLIVEYTPKLIQLIKDAVTWFQNLDPRMQQIIGAFIALAPVVVIVTQLILTLIPVITALLSPIGVVIVAILTLAAVIFYNWDAIKTAFLGGVSIIKQTLTDAVSFIGN
jgi:hypothetical protein